MNIKVENFANIGRKRKPKNVKTLSYHGYVLIYAPTHPNCTKRGYVFEHRLIVEEKLQRFLNSSEVVHHINGNRSDNRVENLEVLDDVSHKKIKNTGQFDSFSIVKYRWKSSHKIKKICCRCGTEFEHYLSQPAKYCSPECRRLRSN